MSDDYPQLVALTVIAFCGVAGAVLKAWELIDWRAERR